MKLELHYQLVEQLKDKLWDQLNDQFKDQLIDLVVIQLEYQAWSKFDFQLENSIRGELYEQNNL